MAQNNKETKPNYNIDAAKANASTGMAVGSQADLQRYGIDYSQAQRDEIANIFANEATQAYGTAQNEYAKTMAQQQNSLQDTIRRSQAQAVATGASRGMQAANELSAMLGLQEQAAQGATEMQGSYAEALANAQKQAMDMQNTRAQIGSQIAAADIAGEAQKYSVGLDYQANDPYRVLTEIAALRAQGDTAAADALMTTWMSSQGATEAQTSNAVNAANAANAPAKTTWTPGQNGVVDAKIGGAAGASSYGKADYKDLRNGDNDSFDVAVNGKKYFVKASGEKITSANNSELYNTLGNLSGNHQAAEGSVVYYNGRAYISAGGSWHLITGTGDGNREGSGKYNEFITTLQGGGSK